MSDPRLITPLLANHIMGDPISDHHGVRCCPAMLKDSDHKYMVKIISIPASSVQLDALLLSGAYRTPEDALRYFRDLADDTVEEAKILKKLSQLEGFCCYDSWQVEPMEDGSGYDVYLLSEYGQTLERCLRRDPLTHLAAVNLGLDLCAALSVCRRNGYLYVDLKPENIFFSENRGYLIGDLGFISLSSLKYASLPEKYRSAYTAPEITDAYSSLNTTLDIYAAGLVLYQVYNNGQLPEPGHPIAPPEYADYEMAEIILKACAENPEDRWQDPQEMGQALVSYMQRNTVNDTPIIPLPVPEPAPEAPEPDAAPITDEEEVSEPAPLTEDSDPEPEEEIPEPPAEEIPEESPISDDQVEESTEISPEESSAVDEPVEIQSEGSIEAEGPDEPQPETEEDPEQFTIEGFLFDETLPDEDNVANLTDTLLSDEVNQMLAQADELIAHKAPDPVVAPEPIDVPMPDPIVPEPEPPAEESQPGEEPLPEPETAPEEAPIPEEPAPAAEDDGEEEPELPPVDKPRQRRKLGCLISALVALLLALALGLAGYYYYQTEYLQHIESVTLNGAEDHLTVILDTDIDNSLLTVVCTDTYGSKLTQPVENNRATFTSLPSGSTYKITVIIDGFHQLTGNSTATYTTATQTSIVSFTAITGDTDGSVILNFSVQGPDSDTWLVKYSAGGAEQTVSCTGHMAIISGLEPGTDYTFRLVPQEQLYLVGDNTLEFTASAVIYAQDLTIHGFENGALSATWEIPGDAAVETWSVRCYNNTGFDATYTTTEPAILIPDLDLSQGYTLEVTASGMTVSKWTSISANSVTFKDLLIDNSDPSRLVVTWPYEGTAPEGGWPLMYTVDGSAPVIVQCEKNTYTLETLVPGGTYSFSFVLPEETSVFGGTGSCTVPGAEMFAGYEVTAENMSFRLCRTPAKAGWIWSDVAEEDYTTEFTVGESASLVVYLNEEYVTSPNQIETLFVIRDQNGSVTAISSSTQSWTSMWYKGYCELDVPSMPSAPGSYTLEIYLNGAYATTQPLSFTIS